MVMCGCFSLHLKLSFLYVEMVLYCLMFIFILFYFSCVSVFVFGNERLCFRIIWFEILRSKDYNSSGFVKVVEVTHRG